MQREADDLSQRIEDELEEAEGREDYEVAATLKKLRREATELNSEADALTTDDVTDKKYQLEDRKRKLAQQLHDTTRDKHLAEVRAAYEEERRDCQALVQEQGNDQEQKYLRDILAQEPAVVSSGHAQRVQDLISKLSSVRYGILWRQPAFLSGLFRNLERQVPRMNQPDQAERLLQDSRRAMEAANWPGLRSINSQLLNLLPRAVQESVKANKIGF